MTKFTFNKDATTLITDAEVTVTQSNGGETADAYYQRMLAENDLTEAGNTLASGFNGDDTSWYWNSLATITPKWKIPMGPHFTYGSESHFGFGATPFTSSGSPGTAAKVRGFSSTPFAPILFFWATNIDSGSFNTRLVGNAGTLVLKAKAAHYNGNTDAQDMVAVFKPTRFTFYFKKTNAASHGFYAATYNGSTRYSEQKLADLYVGGDTTTVDMAFETTYKPSGNWYSPSIPLDAITSYVGSSVTWTEDKPAETSIQVSAVITDTNVQPSDDSYVPIISGNPLPNLQEEDDLSTKFLWLKVALSTALATKTPQVLSLTALVTGFKEQRYVQLNIEPTDRFNNSLGPITVTYDQTKGFLNGTGGAIVSYSQPFDPVELVPVPNPGHRENITHTQNIIVSFTRVFYQDVLTPSEVDRNILLGPIVKSMTITFTKVGGTGV